jgi:hypothetical protein
MYLQARAQNEKSRAQNVNVRNANVQNAHGLLLQLASGEIVGEDKSPVKKSPVKTNTGEDGSSLTVFGKKLHTIEQSQSNVIPQYTHTYTHLRAHFFHLRCCGLLLLLLLCKRSLQQISLLGCCSVGL